MHRQNSFLRRRAGSFSSIQQPTSQPSSSIPFYSNVLSHKCRYLEVLVYSPEMTSSLPDEPSISVFGERDRLGGQVILHPGSPEVGRINITVEGSFYYPASTGDHPGESFHDSDTMRKSVFLSTTHVINVVAMQAESQLGSKATMLNAFGPKRRPSVPSLRIHTSYSSEDRSFPFALDLPRGARPGEDKPATYSSSDFDPLDAEPFKIAYSLKVTWQATDMCVDSVVVEVPIMIHSDRDFSSLDALPEHEQSWLEMPLKCDRPAPYRCAVTLPTDVTFSRPSSIPFFVVFTTTPRSTDFAREITSDSTISVSLLRQITITEMPVLPPTPPMTPYSTNSSISSDESGEGGYKSSKLFKLKRPIQARPPRTRTGSAGPMVPPKLPSNGFAFPILEEPSQKPLPRIQKQTVWTQSQILHTCFSPGFPKRPRLNFEGRKHPSIEEVASLPDGLFRNKIPLDKNILGSIDWPGVSVKYYLDVSVLVREEDFRARVPIRIL